MYFVSDNGAGASPKVIEAVAKAFSGPPALSYGRDEQTKRVEAMMSELFEREVAVFLMTSGTATNGLALAHLSPPWGAVFCHAEAHINVSECAGPETLGGGSKLIGLPGAGAKIAPETLEAAIGRLRIGDAHSVQPGSLSLTNLTECGMAYTPTEVRALADIAKAHGMPTHMDGARFANALVATGATPAEMTWKAGVDALSFGATKNGAMAAEAVVFFDAARGRDFLYRRMRAGHLLSKMRLVSAQFEAWLDGDHWLDLARHANGMARRLADGLVAAGHRTAWEVQGNEVFLIAPKGLRPALAARGVMVYPWGADSLAEGAALPETHEILRLICSFATREEEVAGFVALAAEFG